MPAELKEVEWNGDLYIHLFGPLPSQGSEAKVHPINNWLHQDYISHKGLGVKVHYHKQGLHLDYRPCHKDLGEGGAKVHPINN